MFLTHTYNGPAWRLDKNGALEHWKPETVSGAFGITRFNMRPFDAGEVLSIDNGEGQKWLILRDDGGTLKDERTGEIVWQF